ncbi:hypothetical protein BOTBODRAFT_114885 [Botryobasidium botryosum FD-172 SS1]|uniref:Protein kinase domain-containing protein n=1 Tax=Botryobasidium botryosum (strain FD-172 SS1) TaxID=930990 RepID=A0A067MHN8_BOTB1|nr:hypothetical protein BOTBODRAFT_114885 [Botryobasidium botryosum FD-172 SS1]
MHPGSQLIQITQGLEYLHARNPPIIHGDLKANNVLISGDGTACLSDFGLSRTHAGTNSAVVPVTSGGLPIAPITMAYHANFRWGAPEVLLDGMRRTPASDIYSLGRLKVELLTGEIPFPNLADQVIIQRIAAGRYDRPTGSDAVACGLDDEMWALILECWDRNPLKRPSASQVVEQLRRMPEPASVSPSWKPSARVGRGGCSASRELISSRFSDSIAGSSS